MTAAESGTLLLVDDDSIVTRTLEALLRAETQFDVVSFNRPTDALESLAKLKFDLVLSDFLMPELDGVTFLKQVRELQPEATRILLTGYADKQNAIRSINEAGLYHYLEKPWDNDNLLIVVRNGVERAQLVRELNETLSSLVEKDRSLEQIRSRLLKAIL